MIAEVAGLDAEPLRADLAAFECRNNRLAQLALEQDGFADAVRVARAQFGAARIGVFLGTSTSGILETEIAYRHRDPATGALPAALDYRRSHNSYSVVEFVRSYFDLTGPAAAVCTACSSGAKVFGNARRMIEAGLIDAAVVGGVDSLCLTTLYGFHSLEVLSATACRPFDPERNGISIGEGAAFALLGRAETGVCLLGVGESSDAHHMSAPHPQGLGAQLAMQAALQDAAARARGDRLHQPARHRDAGQRRGGSAARCRRYSAVPSPAARRRAPPGMRSARPARSKRSSRRSRWSADWCPAAPARARSMRNCCPATGCSRKPPRCATC